MSSSGKQPQNEPPKTNLVDQISDAVIKVLIGSGGFSTLYLLFMKQIPEALIALGVTIGATLLTSFGKGLMKPLKSWFTQRGDKVGITLTKVADGTIENWSGIDAKYLQALQTYCYDLEVEGLKADLPPLALSEVFVPIRLDSDPMGFSGGKSLKQIWDLLPKRGQVGDQNPYRRLAIVADPGYGKTTLTRHLTLNYANQNHRNYGVADLLPILLIFRSMYGQIQDERTPALPELILCEISKLPRCQDLSVSADWFKARLKQGKCLVMFDGLDEVPDDQRERVSKWVNWQMQAYPSQFILTSRPHGYDSTLFKGIERVGILDFTNDQKEEFINRWYRAVLWHKKWKAHFEHSQDKPTNERLSQEQVQAQCEFEAKNAAASLMGQIISNPALNTLAKNPLLVTIISNTYKVFEYLPDKRIQLYKKMFELLLENRPNRRETRLTISNAEDNQQVLQLLALRLTEHNLERFTFNQVRDWIKVRLANNCPDEPLAPKAFLNEIQTISGLLAGGEGNLYEFTHKTFQEYLAAAEIQTNYSPDYLIEKVDNPDWQEVICFYIAMTSATPFVEAVLVQPTRENLKLARRVVIEEKAKIEASVKAQLEAALAQVDLGDELNARVKLEQRFQNLVSLNQISFDTDPITWGEYQLFLEDQLNGQFHSKAQVKQLSKKQFNIVNLPISWQDANWFCAWLSTQKDLQPDEGVYDYRLPTEAEWRDFPPGPLLPFTPGDHAPILTLQPFIQSADIPGNTLCIVRVKVHDRYKKLINFLANGRWREADEETFQVMFDVTGRKKDGRLSVESIKNFPCEDLQLIDQLWLKFSGGHFGFSVQKKIWIEVGGKLDFGKDGYAAWTAYKEFSDRVGWREGNKFLSHEQLIFNLIFGEYGHLPCIESTNTSLVWEDVDRVIGLLSHPGL